MLLLCCHCCYAGAGGAGVASANYTIDAEGTALLVSLRCTAVGVRVTARAVLGRCVCLSQIHMHIHGCRIYVQTASGCRGSEAAAVYVPGGVANTTLVLLRAQQI